MNFLDFIKTYGIVIIVGLFTGCLYVMRTIKEEAIDTKTKMIQFILYGMGSSMLITWIGYETFIYYGLPSSLACAVGGGLGFIGAETIARLIISFLKHKSGLDDEVKK